jgi:cytochrome b involved in lipid metabolism
MMRKLYFGSTIAFWGGVLGFWIGNVLTPVTQQPALAAERAITAAELAGHVKSSDCWMAIRGGVYDLTKYLPDHPSRPQIIEPWCGKEATEAYETKTKSRAHSPEADTLLAKFRLGRFVVGG